MFKLVIFFITMVSVAVAAPSASATPSEDGKVKRDVIYSPSTFYGANPGLLPINYQSPLAYNAPALPNYAPALTNYAPALPNYAPAPALTNYAPLTYNAPLAPLTADFHHHLPHNYGYGYVPNNYIVN